MEFDDFPWQKREWLSVYGDDFHLLLLEHDLVLAHRSSPPTKAASAQGTLHPALVRTDEKCDGFRFFLFATGKKLVFVRASCD